MPPPDRRVRNQENRQFLMGQSQIIRDVNGNTYRKDVAPDEDGPVRELGNPFIFDSGKLTAWQASIELRRAQDVSLFARMPGNPNQASEASNASISGAPTGTPWDVQPQVDGNGLPLGGVVPVGRVQIGHLGCTEDWYFNMNIGSSHRVPLSGSSAKFAPIMVPKYFLADDTAPALRVYDVSAGIGLGPSVWNQPTAALLQQSLGAVASQANIFTRKAICHAWFSQASTEVDEASRTVRKFFGSVKAQGAAFSASSLVPVAYGATHVALHGSGLRGGTANPLAFFQVRRGTLVAGAATAPIYTGPFSPFGTATAPVVPLIDNCEWIIVTSPTTFAGNDILFEVDFYYGA